MTRLALFDLDGTILDTLSDLYASVNRALRTEHLAERTIEEVRSYLGNGIRLLIKRAVPEHTESAVEERVFSAFVRDYEQHCADQTAPFEGIPELFASLKKNGVKIAIVSNKADFAAQKLCQRFFSGAYDFAIGAKDGVAKKPARDMIDEALSHFSGICERDCVYIGDSEVDVETAQNAGMREIAVLWGFRTEAELKNAGATNFAANTQELLQKIISA